MQGVVVKSTGNQYLVRLDDQSEIICRTKGNLRLKDYEATNPITVGDRVEVKINDFEGELHWISSILPRKNYIIRKSVKLSKQVQIIAANIDRAFVVATPVLPKTSLGFIDRFLATAEAYRIPAGIIWNKSDVFNADVFDFLSDVNKIYEAVNYETHIVSAITGDGLDKLTAALKGKINLFSGHSGVGKSSLINKLIPDLQIKTGGLSSGHMKGTHTTTFAEMHTLPFGGFIIDTPGIREFGTIEFAKTEVSHYFPEIFNFSKNCKFSNCIHTNEVSCAVKDAVGDGAIAMSRYESYLSILGGQDIFR